MKKLIYLLLAIFFLVGCAQNTNYVTVKYHDDLVDIAHSRFEYLDTSKSSFVNGAWYDKGNEYMVIRLKETYYHYCGMPKNAWISFKDVSSFGTYYTDSIKGDFDCRNNFIPSYKEDDENSIIKIEDDNLIDDSEGVVFRNPVLDFGWKLSIEEDSPYFPEDNKSVFVEKIQSANKLTVSWIITLDGNYILRTKDIFLIGIEPKQICKNETMAKIAQEIANEENYIILESDPNIYDASFRYAWLRSKDNGTLYENINDELIKSGYAKRATSYDYSEIENLKKLEDLARLEKRGLWKNDFVCN